MKKIFGTLCAFVAVVALSLAFPASAENVNLGGAVKHLETTYYPQFLVFTLSSGNSTCPAGKALTYASSNLENMKAALSVLMAAQLSGRLPYLYYDTNNVNNGPLGTNGCAIAFIGLN